MTSRGALTTSSRSTRMSSSDEREAPLGGKVVELALHLREHVAVDLADVGIAAEAVAKVDRRQHLDRDLRRERYVAEHVADVQAPRHRQRDRHHLQAERAVEPEQAREALAAAQEDRRLLAADGDDGDD